MQKYLRNVEFVQSFKVNTGGRNELCPCLAADQVNINIESAASK